MKKQSFWILILCLLFTVPMYTSCQPADDEELQTTEIDKSLIVGKWVNSSDSHEHWEYKAMSGGKGKGVYWDSSEMSYEDAAAGPGLFEYYFNQTGMMRVFWMETTGSYSNPDTEAPFVIDELTSSKMVYHSSGATRKYTFTRQ